MARISEITDLIRCSFCSKSQEEVDQLIAGQQIYICDRCVALCNEILEGVEKKQKDEMPSDKHLEKPKEIAQYLDQYVIGQRRAKHALAVAVYNHYKRVRLSTAIKDDGEEAVELEKSNVLLLGPTGVGKTHLARTLARKLDVPFTVVDATALTETGYVGEDVEYVLGRLLQAAEYDVERAEYGIIYIDEIDKISRKADRVGASRDVSGEGVQQALLKILEGSVVNVSVHGNRKSAQQESVQMDTSKILFIAAGAFAGLEDIIAKRLGRGGIGFGSDLGEESESEDLLHHVQTEDLYTYGLIPEFIGRLPVIATVEAFDVETLVRVLIEPRNALMKQYKRMLEIDGVELEFDDEAVRAVAEQALERKTGARGLRSILERVLASSMFHAPSDPTIRKILVTRECVVDGLEPLVVRDSVTDRSQHGGEAGAQSEPVDAVDSQNGTSEIAETESAPARKLRKRSASRAQTENAQTRSAHQLPAPTGETSSHG